VVGRVIGPSVGAQLVHVAANSRFGSCQLPGTDVRNKSCAASTAGLDQHWQLQFLRYSARWPDLLSEPTTAMLPKPRIRPAVDLAAQ
jgi:hypothetical protein